MYERGEGRRKHCWKHDYAGFKPSKRGAVGKCANSINDSIAEVLLRSGVAAESPYQDQLAYPDKIYNIYKGVPYVAVPTQPGKSYHGFPWRGRMDPAVRECLRKRAHDEGTVKRFEKWLDKHSEN